MDMLDGVDDKVKEDGEDNNVREEEMMPKKTTLLKKMYHKSMLWEKKYVNI